MSDWQDISTAPKDGTFILVWAMPYVEMAHWRGRWRIGNDVTGTKLFPTHWMPLPPAPEIKQ